jgi:hypothetical protein
MAVLGNPSIAQLMPNALRGQMAEQKLDGARAARQIFVAKTIVSEVETEKEVHGVVSNLSLFGC